MDKSDALRISKIYLNRVQQANIGFTEAWLFGSFAKGNQHDNSDLAIILNETAKHTFETDVALMVLRKGEETLIEPHAFTLQEFDVASPIVSQIMKYGERIGL